MELTDLDICKKIAEIEGLDFTEGNHKVFFEKDFVKTIYNPLTDDALCFQLMVKHEINVNFTECPAGTGKAWYATGYTKKHRDTLCTEYTGTPNKAICLAIIEAHSNAR